MSAQDTPQVRRRRVYYLSGFDPRGAAYYHRLYRNEAARQAVHHPAPVTVGPRRHHGAKVEAWPIEACWGSVQVHTDYRFLVWDDIVRRHWDRRLPALLWSTLKSATHFVSCGAFARLRRLFRGPLFAALYPVSYALLVICTTVMFAAGVIAIAPHPFATPAAAAGSAILLWGAARLAERLGMLWLLRIFVFVHRWGARGIPGLDVRVNQFVRTIARDQAEHPCDEVLLVGHSVGSMLAVAVAARLASQLSATQRANITLLTLGQCIPLLSAIPEAAAFRRDLATLAQVPDLAWLDMNALADALCFAQASPLVASGLPVSRQRPLRQVVRPFRMFSPADYARIRRNKLRLHFQYLMASDLPNEYDYFRMTAGPGRIQATQPVQPAQPVQLAPTPQLPQPQ